MHLVWIAPRRRRRRRSCVRRGRCSACCSSPRRSGTTRCAAVIAVMAAPSGSDLNPARLDGLHPGTRACPRTASSTPRSNASIDRGRSGRAPLSAIVTREGRVSGLERSATTAGRPRGDRRSSTRSREAGSSRRSSAAPRSPSTSCGWSRTRRSKREEARSVAHVAALTALALDLCHGRRDVVHRVGGADDDAARRPRCRPASTSNSSRRESGNAVLRIDHPPAARVERILDALHRRLLVADHELTIVARARRGPPAAPRCAAACCRCRS